MNEPRDRDTGVTLRPETPGDRPGIFRVNAAAFDTDAEARLVDRLRGEADPVVSLVAVNNDEIVGHVLFSPMTLEQAPNARVMGLAPMAVSPDFQHRGIGSALVDAGLEACRSLGAGAVFVLGHPAYYPRFGFVPASRFGIHSEYDVPDEAFMVLALERGFLDGMGGQVSYHPAFQGL